MSEFPCPVPPKPPMARGWCKHYSNKPAPWPKPRPSTPEAMTFGPQCAVGAEPCRGDACYPDPKDVCDKRENWSDEEKATWEAWQHHSMSRVIVCMEAIPKDGWGGKLPCPACGTGTISWSLARVNRHIHAACSTKRCFVIMQ